MPCPIDRVTCTCRTDQGREPTPLKGLRITLLVLAILTTIAGIISLFGVPYISQMGHIAAYTCIGVGVFVAFLCSLFKGVKGEILPPAPNPNAGIGVVLPNSIIKNSGDLKQKQPAAPQTQSSLAITNSVNDENKACVLSKLPLWLQPHLRTAPTVEVTDETRTLKNLVTEISAKNHEVCLLKGTIEGLYLKVQVQHINENPDYDKECEQLASEADKNSQLPPTSQPFTAHILVRLLSDRSLIVYTQSPALLHRHSADRKTDTLFDRFHIINEVYNFDFWAEHFESQNDLPANAQHSLEWFLKRLFTKESLKVKEERQIKSTVPSEAVVGYWQVSLNQPDTEKQNPIPNTTPSKNLEVENQKQKEPVPQEKSGGVLTSQKNLIGLDQKSKPFFADQLPPWLAPHISADIATEQMPSSVVKDIIDVVSMKHSLCLLTAKDDEKRIEGIYLKVQVSHINLDDKHDQRCKETAQKTMEETKKDFPNVDWSNVKQYPLSSEPFQVDIIVYTIPSKDGRLPIATASPIRRHRHSDSALNLFQTFNSVKGVLDYDALIEIETQGADLHEKAWRSLEWFVLRLVQKGHLKAREDIDITADFKKPPVGMWDVSLVKNKS